MIEEPASQLSIINESPETMMAGSIVPGSGVKTVVYAAASAIRAAVSWAS